MKSPRHPIAIIGAGIAGLAAATTLEKQQIPHFLLEKFAAPGGRLSSRTGDGWTADHGTPYIRRNDLFLAELTRLVGLDDHRVSIQGGIHRLHPDLSIERMHHSGIDVDRLCFTMGFGGFMHKLAATSSVRYGEPVKAIRWDNDEKHFWWDKEGQVFWFEDDKGEPIRDEISREVMMASGVILATTPTAAARIAGNSRSLAGLVPLLSSIKTSRVFSAMFKTPRIHPGYYALEGTPECMLSLVAFEETKAPNRIAPEYSLIVVQASPAFTETLAALPEEQAAVSLWEHLRRIYPELPAHPVSQTWKRWDVARCVSKPLGFPMENQWPINPVHAPFQLAGDYLLGNRAEDAAQSGVMAANAILAQLPTRRSFMGLEMQR